MTGEINMKITQNLENAKKVLAIMGFKPATSPVL